MQHQASSLEGDNAKLRMELARRDADVAELQCERQRLTDQVEGLAAKVKGIVARPGGSAAGLQIGTLSAVMGKMIQK